LILSCFSTLDFECFCCLDSLLRVLVSILDFFLFFLFLSL
jgi:hypothetical protein